MENVQEGPMGRNKERDAREQAARMKQIAQTAFQVYAERTIDAVTFDHIAEACGKGVASIYRHYPNKTALVLAASTVAWEEYLAENSTRFQPENSTGAQRLAFFLDSFLDLYRNHKDLLRFNQFFNVYVQSANVSPELLQPYMDVIRGLIGRLQAMYAVGRVDGTLRTDIPEQEMISALLHLMLAAVTRYAVGLVYNNGSDPEEELILLRDMLLTRFVVG